MWSQGDLKGIGRILGCMGVILVVVLIAVGILIGRCSTKYQVKVDVKQTAKGGEKHE